MGVGPFALISSRAEVIDYFQPIFVDYIRVMGGRGDLKVDTWGFLLPLEVYVWILIVASLVLLASVMLILPLCVKSETTETSEVFVGVGGRSSGVDSLLRILLQQRKLCGNKFCFLFDVFLVPHEGSVCWTQ
ncbi:hypothetical protein Pmani_003440 [Petrolisthes manimaculis]|uniref:Uncharacterized protein n=1 Tax=Petrolisthes manimaculis TaxID=1843537 RepID=A0AAE1QIK1_9EUCA|nr:hypothetical protein Pmani_003440 [Petrolisthes manimaculis]